MAKYTLITPESLWTVPGIDTFVPLLPSGCSFIDVLAAQIRRHGNGSALFYAGYMELEHLRFCHTVEALTGTRATQWIERLEMLDNEWLLLNTMLKVSEISRRRGYGCVSDFSWAWKKRYGVPPREYRLQKRRVITRVVTEIRLK